MSDDAASLYHILEQYPDEASAERYFIQRRWPSGVRAVKKRKRTKPAKGGRK